MMRDRLGTDDIAQFRIGMLLAPGLTLSGRSVL